MKLWSLRSRCAIRSRYALTISREEKLPAARPRASSVSDSHGRLSGFITECPRYCSLLAPLLAADRFVLRWGGARVREIFAHVQDVLAAKRIAVMRAVEDAFGAVQPHAHARSGQRLGRGAEMMQERLHLTPLDVAAHRIVKDGSQQAFVLATQGCRSRGRLRPRSIPDLGPNARVRLLRRRLRALRSQGTSYV